jgi:hypothetical protein
MQNQSLARKAMAKTFYFHGQGVGLGGVVTRPFQQLIEARAAASLAITGGKAAGSSGQHTVPDLKDPKCQGLPEVVSIDSALTEISGALEGDGVYRTRVSATVEGLNVGQGTVTADSVVAKVLTEHYPDESEPRINVSGSTIENLKVKGQEVKVDIDGTLFDDLNTYSKFRDKFDEDAAFKKDMRRRFLWGDLKPDEVPNNWREQYDFAERQKSLPKARGIVPCSVVKGTSGGSGFQTFRHILVIPDFGTIFLGELLLQDYARRLTMMRLKLGSPMAAELAVASGEGNGTSWP